MSKPIVPAGFQFGDSRRDGLIPSLAVADKVRVHDDIGGTIFIIGDAVFVIGEAKIHAKSVAQF